MTAAAALGPSAEIKVSAGPFPRMSSVAAFCARLRTLPGVRGVHLDRYGSGSIVLTVRHGGSVPLAVQLRGLRELGVELVTGEGEHIEVRVRST